MGPALIDAEEFWDDLLAYIEGGRVIPVAGAELLTVEESGQTMPLYRAVAERLLRRYGLPTDQLPKNCELNAAVCRIAAAGKRVRDLYRPVNDILQQLLPPGIETPPALRQLASIRHFDLFATTTPDDLLARAIDAVRFNGAAITRHIEYAPKLPTDRRRDIPERPASQYAAVFYLFGKSDVGPFYAIHDEDALEFPYSLQAGNGPERIFSQLRSRNLLLIGCAFADWLSRFFLRLSNSERLSDQREKKEFVVGNETAGDENFTVFLQRFSQDSRFYAIDAREFVAELHRRWKARNPSLAVETAADSAPAPGPSPGTIFISYAGQDLAAARKLFEGLHAIGGDVAWFDKSELKSGDDWHREIVAAIQRCSLFLPLLSANTEQRPEGYFRREWRKAAERAEGIQGRKFILPIAIDTDYAGDMARYRLVPEEFARYQYGHAPAGELIEPLKGAITEQLRVLRRARAA